MSHISVLPEEVLLFLRPEKCFVMGDATLGMGGHTELFLQKNPHLRVLAFDQDPYAREKAFQRLSVWKDQVEIFPENFEYLPERFHERNILADGILFDIGVSSLQLDDEKRGFSFRNDGPLDMRMNPSSGQTAADIIAHSSEEELAHLFWTFGEERYARKIAAALREKRDQEPFTTTAHLATCISEIKPRGKREGGGHPAAQVFQALRIAVNRELEVLETALNGALKCLALGGRLAVISFQSLEDRIVKNVFHAHETREKRQKYPSLHTGEDISSHQEKYAILTKKPLVPSPEEIIQNPRARSARMRVIERIQ